MIWSENELLYGVNLRGLGNATVQTSQVGVDEFKLNMDGDVSGN